jgi:hypothetical protein
MCNRSSHGSSRNRHGVDPALQPVGLHHIALTTGNFLVHSLTISKHLRIAVDEV